jgi:hypothetical protein
MQVHAALSQISHVVVSIVDFCGELIGLSDVILVAESSREGFRR